MGFLRKVALLCACLGVQTSFAAEQGFYFGLNAGQAKYDFANPPRVAVATLPSPIPSFNPFPTNPSFGLLPSFPFTGAINVISPVEAYWLPGDDDKDRAWGATIGYRIFRYAAFEGSYADLGTLNEHQDQIATTNFIIPAVDSKLETGGPTASVLAIVPLTEQWEMYLRGGMAWIDQKSSLAVNGVARSSTTYGSDSLLFGAGTQFDIGAHWTVRLDFQRYDDVGEKHGIGEADIDVWSLGVLFRL